MGYPLKHKITKVTFYLREKKSCLTFTMVPGPSCVTVVSAWSGNSRGTESDCQLMVLLTTYATTFLLDVGKGAWTQYM